MSLQIQIRGDTATNWATSNPILADRELGYDRDAKAFKIGDGISEWTSLPYSSNLQPGPGFKLVGNELRHDITTLTRA